MSRSETRRVIRVVRAWAEVQAEREQKAIEDIKDMNTPAWGMCMGALETLGDLKEFLAELEVGE